MRTWREFFYKNKYVHHFGGGFEWIILAGAALLSAISIYYTQTIVDQIKEREIDHIHLYAKALEHVLNSEKTEVPFAAEQIIYKDNAVPAILTNEANEFIFFQNLDIDSSLNWEEQQVELQNELDAMKRAYPPIPIVLKDPATGEVFGRQFIFYKNSRLLTQLTVYPFIQFSILAFFSFIAYLAFNYSKKAEQNRIWKGLAKETAHQLGTPLSSLMAWVEMLRQQADINPVAIANELDKDVKKFSTITERFSNMGATPTRKIQDVGDVVRHAVHYLQTRIPPSVHISIYTPSAPVLASINAPLLEWVIEIVCKNAVDAMEGVGSITIDIALEGTKRVLVDVSDTGPGIPAMIAKKVFRMGFTTKKHGWGLGLPLAQRIIEQYHGGRMTVRPSQGEGGAFRIELRSD